MTRSIKIATGAGIAALALLAVIVLPFVNRGLSAREEPTAVEEFLARRMRALAMPRAARETKNPVTLTSEVLASGRAHFADHCAACHANDGSGQTHIGQSLYPKAPDMRRSETQSLTDGELFYVIENGIRLTGMPAWGTGTPENAEESWHLVHFIRHLPKLTAKELEEMEPLNPRSAEEGAEGMPHSHGASAPQVPAVPAHKH